MKTCDKCNGTGKEPQWPNPYTPLPPNVISRIRDNAPDCSKCGGKGEVEDD